MSEPSVYRSSEIHQDEARNAQDPETCRSFYTFERTLQGLVDPPPSEERRQRTLGSQYRHPFLLIELHVQGSLNQEVVKRFNSGLIVVLLYGSGNCIGETPPGAFEFANRVWSCRMSRLNKGKKPQAKNRAATVLTTPLARKRIGLSSSPMM